MAAQDKHPAVLIKDAILARSGIYVYGRDEMVRMGHTPKDNKAAYRVYRPPNVLVDCKDKFAFAVVTKEHPAVDTSPDNFRKQAEGFVGNAIDVVALEDGNIGLKGEIAFYTRDMADYFEQGNKETSAQYGLKLRPSTNSERDGYEYVMTDITYVNGLALTARGRGGSSVRVLDSIETEKTVGGFRMKKGFLSFLGIGKTKDEGFKFSEALLSSMTKVKALDASDTAGVEKEVAGVMDHVTALGDSEEREVLAGAVADCYKNIEAVLSKKDEVSLKLDELYAKCCDADTEAVRRIFEAKKGSGKDKDDDKGKDGGKDKDKGKDSAPLNIDAVIAKAVDEAFVKVDGSIEAKIDAAMKKALNAGGGAGGSGQAQDASGVADAAGDDASFMVRGVFGNR